MINPADEIPSHLLLSRLAIGIYCVEQRAAAPWEIIMTGTKKGQRR